jgi:hypothetical protein
LMAIFACAMVVLIDMPLCFVFSILPFYDS